MYLRKIDYYNVIQSDNLDIIIRKSEEDLGEEVTVLEFMNRVAISEASALIAHRYDTNTIFFLEAWSAIKAYSIDELVYYTDNKFYKSLTDSNTGNLPDAGAPNWEEVEDPREPKLLISVLDIALFHIHKRINPRNIPEVRQLAYEDAIEWLKMVGNDEITPQGLTKLPLDEAGNEPGAKIEFGGSNKQNMSY